MMRLPRLRQPGFAPNKMSDAERLAQPCGGCGGQRDRPMQRYCRACHAKYQRETYRPKRAGERAHYAALKQALED